MIWHSVNEQLLNVIVDNPFEILVFVANYKNVEIDNTRIIGSVLLNFEGEDPDKNPTFTFEIIGELFLVQCRRLYQYRARDFKNSEKYGWGLICRWALFTT